MNDVAMVAVLVAAGVLLMAALEAYRLATYIRRLDETMHVATEALRRIPGCLDDQHESITGRLEDVTERVNMLINLMTSTKQQRSLAATRRPSGAALLPEAETPHPGEPRKP